MRSPGPSKVTIAPRLATARLLALLIPALLLGGAYVGQYGFGLYPCEMCWWQRYAHFAALALAIAAFIVPPARVWTGLAAGSIMASGLIGLYHAGVEYKWWRGISSCTKILPSNPGSTALESILNTPMISCDEAQWRFLGISLAGYNCLISVAGALVIFWLLVRKARA